MSTATKHSEQPGPDVDAAHTADRAPEPGSTRRAVYTMTALEGLNAAEIVSAAFARKTIGALTPRKLEVVAPDGPSTSGGKRARQTIRLVPATGGGPAVMCGALEVAQKVVALRTHAGVAQHHEKRFGTPFDVTADEYAAMCKELEGTLGMLGYTFTQEPEELATAAHKAARARLVDSMRPKVRVLNIVVATIVLAIVGAVLTAMFVR